LQPYRLNINDTSTSSMSDAPASLHHLNVIDWDTSFNHPHHVRRACLIAPSPHHQPQHDRSHLFLTSSLPNRRVGVQRCMTHSNTGDWRASIQVTRYAPYFFNLYSFISNDYLLAGYRHDKRGETPLHCVFFHTDKTRGGKPLPVVFPSTQTRQGGVYPPSVVFPSTQTQWEGGNPLCFPSRRHNEKGFTPSPLCFLLHRHDESGETPSRWWDPWLYHHVIFGFPWRCNNISYCGDE
jgi:hypothetical protein